MNRDLFLTILSMDVYNRGYGRSLKFKKDESAATSYEVGKLGNAQILTPTEEQKSGWEAAGFYALAVRRQII